VAVMMWVRWTLPRLRIDQVIITCLKYCTPIAAVMFVGAAFWQYALPERNFFGLLETPDAVYAVDEGWGSPAAKEMERSPGKLVGAKPQAATNESEGGG
jgi:NADH-quinone oxidoreductase subunit H